MNTRLALAALAVVFTGCCGAAMPVAAATLAPTPPMGWNDWAHYQCDYTAATILDNARALVSSGLAARGYDRVTIDDCWMARKRDAAGNLQPNPKRFPDGIAAVAKAIHAMGLKFGIYEDAGSETCGGYAGSGMPKGGGAWHFGRDMRQFAAWGVDYVKLDGCNVQVPAGETMATAYRKAYAAASAAIKANGRPMEFLESAPAYFQGTPAWYEVLGWVGAYGQLWREGTDIDTFDPAHASTPRFKSVLWNYAYNLPLGRYQKPGNWNDPDFIIGGDGGMGIAGTRSQMALWAMMSAPLVLSVDVGRLDASAIRVLGNKAVIRVDQDPLGRMATLVRRTPALDILLKPLANGDYAVAVLNHGAAAIAANVSLASLGFAAPTACSASIENLWTGATSAHQDRIAASIAPHDTIVWRVQPVPGCGKAMRSGAIVMTVDGSHAIDSYGRCLVDSGIVHACAGTAAESWTIAGDGSLHANGQCLAIVDGAPRMRACADDASQHWTYRLNGNLVNAADHRCLGVRTGNARHWAMQACGDNLADQIWALPN